MINFAYAQAASAVAATASLARHRSDGAHEPGTDFLAGGTDMVQLMTEHLRNPGRIIDISALPGPDRIEQRPDHLRLGALVRMSDAAAHPAVRAECPVVSRPCWRVHRHRSAPGYAWRQSAPTHPLRLLPRSRAPCEKREPGRVARPSWARTAFTPCSAAASIASQPMRAISPTRCWCSTQPLGLLDRAENALLLLPICTASRQHATDRNSSGTG